MEYVGADQDQLRGTSQNSETESASKELEKTSSTSSLDSDFNDLSSLSSESDGDSPDNLSIRDGDEQSGTRTFSTLSYDNSSFDITAKADYLFNDNSNNSCAGVSDSSQSEQVEPIANQLNRKKKLILTDSLVMSCSGDGDGLETNATKKPTPRSRSVFKRLGRFFFQGPSSHQTKTMETAHGVIPGTKTSFRDGERDECWHFDEGTFYRKENKKELNKRKQDSSKKVLKLQLSPLEDQSCNMANQKGGKDNEIFNHSDDALKQYSEVRDCSTALCFVLCDSNRHQCLEWQSIFKNCEDVKIKQHTVFECEDNCDAVVIPGNSFGFLDGEPEIQFTEAYGWDLQEDILNVIQEVYDGELLVGQSIITPIRAKDCTKMPGANSLSSNRPKYAIYVPVMRVPLHVGDTVNAYLAFRAALKAVKLHNETQMDDRIRTLLCPALCDGFGSMPPGRIAVQMKAAYDAFTLAKPSILARPTGLGPMATSHVQMTTKSGSWC